MKNLSLVILVIVLLGRIAGQAQANENYLLIRFQNEWQEDGLTNYGTYNVFENNSSESWAFGGRLITGENGFMLVAPQVFFKGWGNLQPGIKYTDNSFDKSQIGPALRWKGTLLEKKVFAIIDASYFFGLSGQKDAVDLWINIVTTGQGWYYGGEFRLYRAEETTTETRPLKVGYRFRNGLAPFVMGEIKHRNGRYFSNSLYLGVEIIF